MTQSGMLKKYEQDYEYAKKNLKNNYPQKDMRDTIFLALLNKKKNKNIYIVSVDYGSPVLDGLEELPKQFINAGISEQNAVSVAAGLSSEGKIVYLYSILTFIVCRSLEQLRLDVCYNNFPINTIGVGPGFAYGQAGPTHHSLEDVSIIRNLPNINFYAPSESELNKNLLSTFKNNKINFLRLERGKLKSEIFSNYDLKNGFRIIKKKSNKIIICYGEMFSRVNNLLDELGKKDYFSVLDLFRLKPIDEKKITNQLKNYSKFLILEEQIMDSGISLYFLDLLRKKLSKTNISIKNISLENTYTYKSRDNFYSTSQNLKKILNNF